MPFIPSPLDLVNLDSGDSGDKRQVAAPLTLNANVVDRITPSLEAVIRGDLSQVLKGKVPTRNLKTKMASRGSKGTYQNSSLEWKILKNPSLGSSSTIPIDLSRNDKPLFECPEIKVFKASSSVTNSDPQIGDNESSGLDDMELEYNLARVGGVETDNIMDVSDGEVGRIPLKEVSNLASKGACKNTSGMEATMINISQAVLKHIDPKS